MDSVDIFCSTLWAKIASINVNLLTLLAGILALLIAYYTLKVIYKVGHLFLTVHEYKPCPPLLPADRKSKFQGRVIKRNGEVVEPDVPGIPNGWYYLMAGSDLEKEQVKHVSLCGQDLAVFRDTDGDVHALDAYCPHLGANLAVAGKVKGTCLECPFHAWRFNGADGKCTNIPGAKKIPDVAKTKSWPVLERNLVIHLWFDVEDREPMYLPRECDEIYEDGWVIHGRSEHIVNCHIAEIPENGADIGHFAPVHRASVTRGSDLETINSISSTHDVLEHEWTDASWAASKEDWYLATGTLRHEMCFMGMKVPFVNNPTQFEQIGPGIVYLQPHALRPMLLLMFAVPMDTFRTKLVHVSLGNNSLLGKLEAVATLRLEGLMVERDMVIWNNKVYNRPSVLAGTPADELIVKFRRWYAQFYSNHSKTAAKQVTDLSW